MLEQLRRLPLAQLPCVFLHVCTQLNLLSCMCTMPGVLEKDLSGLCGGRTPKYVPRAAPLKTQKEKGRPGSESFEASLCCAQDKQRGERLKRYHPGVSPPSWS